MYSEAVISTHVFVPKREVINLEMVKSELTFFPRFGSVESGVPVYKETGKWFGFPLYGPVKPEVRKVHDRRCQGQLINLKFIRELRPWQSPAYTEFKKQLERGKKGFILEAPTAWGKTAIVIRFLVEIGFTALVVVPKTDLIKQWRDRLLFFTNIKKSEIGVVHGRKAEWKNKKVVIGLVHSLALGYLEKDFKNNFGQVWTDEVHAAAPPGTFAPVSTLCNSLYRGGVSATLDRIDCQDRVFKAHFQDCKIVGQDPPNKETPTVLLVDFDGNSGRIPNYYQGLSKRGHLISLLARNPLRNNLLCRGIELMVKSDRQTVVLSDRIDDQLKKIQEFLVKVYGLNHREVGFYTGRESGAEQERVANICKVILATYGMLKMGTDIPRLAGLVYATPQSDPRQSEGRIRRLLDGKKSPVVMDTRDTAYEETKRWCRLRLAHYKQTGCKVKPISIR